MHQCQKATEQPGSHRATRKWQGAHLKWEPWATTGLQTPHTCLGCCTRVWGDNPPLPAALSHSPAPCCSVQKSNQTWLGQNAKGWKTRERDETAVVIITVVSWLLAQGRTVVWCEMLLQSQKWLTVSHVIGSNTIVPLNFQDDLVYIVGKSVLLTRNLQ